ncbi:MAG: rhomboid family intramembrane serine protease, partial [Acholeplasmatales bacterium]
FALIIIITTVYLAQLVSGAFLDINLVQEGGIRTWNAYLGPGGISFALNQEYWRLITAIFLHGNFLHYLFNTFFGLFIIGASLERLIGPRKYVLTLVIAGLGSSAIVYGWNYVSWEFFATQRALGVTIGASGAIFGAMGFLFFLTMTRPEWFTPQDISSIRGLIFINVIFSFFGNISTSGHFGGLLMGVLAGLLLAGEFPEQRNKAFNNPYNPYAHEDWNLEDITVIEDDDDDDRRVW